MLKKYLLRIFSAAIILASTMLAFTTTPVAATPALTLSPSSGIQGIAMTITVTGSGFSASTSGYVWFDTDKDGVMDAGEPQSSVTTTAGGAIPAGVTLTTPVFTASSTYYVQADIPSGGSNEASKSFYVGSTTGAVTIIKYDTDGTTVLNQTTVDYHYMMNMTVLGDGVTHYYHQGPVFIDDEDEETEQYLRWNEDEDTNVQEKDMGAVKGTNIKDLCDLVGGMDSGDELKVQASDGWYKYFAYDNVYNYSTREGPMALTWYKDGYYPDTGYNTGLRLVWFADDSTNPWGIHAFGNWDWHEAASSTYWYYYYQSGEMYPTTTGLSGQVISQLKIYSH